MQCIHLLEGAPETNHGQTIPTVGICTKLATSCTNDTVVRNKSLTFPGVMSHYVTRHSALMAAIGTDEKQSKDAVLERLHHQ